MSYLYPEALDAMQKIAVDLFAMAKNMGKLHKIVHVTVSADSNTGTASVQWDDHGSYLSVRIYMPVLPATYRMSSKEFQSWAAYLYHEVGHPLWTDKYTWETAVSTNRHRLLNSLEDVREEKASIAAGIAANGKAVLTELVESLMSKAWAKGFNPNDPKAIGWTVSYIGRAVCNGYELDTHTLLAKLDPHGPVAMVLSWAIPELGACRSTQDCLDLADRIVAALPKNAPKPKGDQPKGDQPKGDQPKGDQPKGDQPKGDQGEGDQGEGDQGEGDQGEGDQGEGDQGEGDKGEGDQGEGDQGEGDQGEGDQGEGDQGEGDQGEGDKGGKGKGGLTHGDIEDLSSLAPTPTQAVKPNSNKAYNEALVIQAIREANGSKRKIVKTDIGRAYQTDRLTANAAKATRQRALLARALKANDRDEFEGGRNSGRLDTKAFARKAAGSISVFGKRTLTEGYETDVAVLVDGSGSMAGMEIHVALELALVIAQASAQVGVNCDVFMFGSGGNLREITSGKQRPVASRFAGAIDVVGGGTPLCSSMLKVARRQVARGQGKRKLFFAITDGGCNLGIQTMVGTVAYMERALDIEVANLMIGTPVTGAFKTEISVPLKDVCELGLGLLVKQLERGARS